MPKTFKIEDGTPLVDKTRGSKWDEAVQAAIDNPGRTITLAEVFKTPGLASALRRKAADTKAVKGPKTPNLKSRSIKVTRASDDPNTEVDESDPRATDFYIVQLWTESSDPNTPLAQHHTEDGRPQSPAQNLTPDTSVPVNADGVPVHSDGTPLTADELASGVETTSTSSPAAPASKPASSSKSAASSSKSASTGSKR